MLVVETIAKIRRAYFAQKKPIKTICREFRVSRRVVRKVIRSQATEFRYQRSRQPLPRIDPWRDQLDSLLLENEGKPARERLTLIRIFEELRVLGYEGSYDAIRRYAKRWRAEHGAATAEVFVPLSFAPGEAYQFDWSHEIVLINGVTVTVKVAHVRLCHSRMLFVRAYPRETQEMVFDAHNRAFAFFKGACTRGIYDNMKTAVEAVFIGKDRQFNRRFERMCGHYLVDPVACTPASGWRRARACPRESGGREPGWLGARAFLHAAAAGGELRRAQCLVARSMCRLRQSAQASRAGRPHDLAGFRGGAAAVRADYRAIRRVPRDTSVGLEDLLGTLRQQQILGRLARRGTASRDPGLRRSHCDPPGGHNRRRASPPFRPRRDELGSLALRPGARQEARRVA